MRRFSGSLAVTLTSLALFGFVGCGEDNEKAAGDGNATAGVKGPGTADPSTYGKSDAGAKLAPKTAEGSSVPETATPAATP